MYLRGGIAPVSKGMMLVSTHAMMWTGKTKSGLGRARCMVDATERWREARVVRDL